MYQAFKCGLFNAAGRYGDKQTWRKSVLRAYGSVTQMLFQVRSLDHLSLQFDELLTPNVRGYNDFKSEHCSFRNSIIFTFAQHSPCGARHLIS